ncbi:glycoside hydrolase family 2 [Anaerocolumna sedimenticola]|uniref:Glycoside hydrolase family 2 n=1 Tax=Anaerocolumna sedimenticola TaxID=2696063 RepID=A0A6P1TIG7_9FIRM|nr:sugar-binding domain-containing protein [Anaerocolumna sedimenticola]QHQ59841.1 glycoside hydrolase family 2 [Anaerocolumna sedimenticola]
MRSYIKNYPRPQFVRDSWVNLNGSWDFAFDDKNCGEDEKWYMEFKPDTKIQVPFTYETKLSGIQDEKKHENIWYKRIISLSEKELLSNKIMLHFEGSDYITKVWVNGSFAGVHTGGYVRFTFDITKFVTPGENTVVVKAEDTFDRQQPRGKQRWMPDNFGCWYVQTTGIWKTVWLEYVPKVSLTKVKMTPLLTEGLLDLEFEVNTLEFKPDLLLEVTISFGENLINRELLSVLDKNVLTKINVYSKTFDWGIKTWSPDHPDLYDICFRLIQNGEVLDEVASYFGMREIRIENTNILLNGEPLYQRLILDQGYWKDSHLTPPDEEALIEDIDKIHQLGYNGLRKHQKVEDERFLYWCDVKGMLVWSEVPASYQFSDYAIHQFTKEWMDIVVQNYNHPCIITWTPFNESWGIPQVEVNTMHQHFTEAIYYLTKSIDKFRPVIVNDGWEHTISDIITLHDYEEEGEVFYNRYINHKEAILSTEIYHSRHKSAMANGYEYKGQPIIISEYGGIAFNNDDSGWGYGNKVNTEEDFIRRFDNITTALKRVPFICGYCYTQVSDVQQEINGLMDMDRNFKVNPDEIRKVNLKK